MDHWSEQRRQAALEHLEQSGWLKHVLWLEEIDSTNSLARRLLASHLLPLPALLAANQQTAGRGRSARPWWSPNGCLMFSLVVDKQHLPPDPLTWPQLSLVCGVAAAIAVEREVPNVQVQLKWPNDLYVHNRKLAGILVEAVPTTAPLSDESSMAFVIGIGLNVAVDFRDAPRDVQDKACSLSQFSSVALTLEAILVRLVEQLELELAAWRAGQDAWWRGWSQRSLLSGRAVHLQLSNGQQLIGLCTGIDSTGYLMLQDNEQVHRIQSAEILRWE